MNRSIRLVRHLALAALGLLLATAASAARSGHGPSKEAFASFVTDELGPLLVGQEIEWKGHHLKITKVHEILKTQLQRTRRTDIDRDVPYIGWVWAVLHLDMDGKRMRVTLDGNARWESGDAGWSWSKVMIYLGDNDSYDFVSREIK